MPAGSQPGDPTVGSDGTLTWSVSPLVGTNYRITFSTSPSLTLGPSPASASLVPTGSPTASTPAPTQVNVGDTFEPNDTPATAKPIDTSSFYLSYITSKTDVDYYTFPVPAAGTRVTFNLSHLPADYDLVVYGPAGAQQLRPQQPTTPPLDGAPLADTGFGTTHATDPLAPQTLNDVALVSNLPVFGVSTLRGTQDDAVTVVSDGGAPGDVYTIQVSGFDGASSDQPYMLRADTTPPPITSSCVPRSFTGTGTIAPALVTTAPGQAASEVTTLFVVERPAARQHLRRGRGRDSGEAELGRHADGLRRNRLPGGRRARRLRTRASAPPTAPGTPARPIPARRTSPCRPSAACWTACGRRTRTSSTS